MSRAEAWILGSIPIAMGLICVAYGIYVFSNASERPTSPGVVAFLAAICQSAMQVVIQVLHCRPR